MLHNLKKSLFEILIKIDKNISIYFEDVEVETLFDQKGDFTTNAALKFSKIFGKNPNQLADIILKTINLNNFEKVEIVEIQEQEKSEQALNNMIKHVESILIELGLSYRLVKLCGGDLGFTSSLTYDFEVFSPGQNKWLEVSSISNFKTYQSNRLKLRYKDTSGKIKLCHTLNGSSLALPRIFSTIIETFQKKNFIEIPKVLQKYTGFSKIDL